MMRIARAMYFWTMLLGVTLVLYIFVLLLRPLVLLGFFPQDGSPFHWVASLWGRTLMAMMPGWKVHVEGREFLPEPSKPVVMVANHESMTDIWAMYYLGVQFRWLSKDSIFRIPIIGSTMRWCGYVPVDRKSRESGSEAMRQSGLRLAQGTSMFFFPEGTRSVDGKIKKFKLGAFKLAESSQVPVLPIVIHGAGDLFAKGSIIPGNGANIHIKILSPLPAPARGTDLDLYSQDVQLRITEAHSQLLKQQNGSQLGKDSVMLASF